METAIDPKLVDEALAAGGGLAALPYIRDKHPDNHRLVAAMEALGPHWAGVVVMHGPGGQRRIVWVKEGDSGEDYSHWLPADFPAACIAAWDRRQLQSPSGALAEIVRRKALIIPNTNGTMSPSIAKMVECLRVLRHGTGGIPLLLRVLLAACAGDLPTEDTDTVAPPPITAASTMSPPDDLLVAQRSYEEIVAQHRAAVVEVQLLHDHARRAASELESARERLAAMERTAVSSRQAYASLILKYGRITIDQSRSA